MEDFWKKLRVQFDGKTDLQNRINKNRDGFKSTSSKSKQNILNNKKKLVEIFCSNILYYGRTQPRHF